tara:strand:- start:3121 stop:3579 length:459 start_codon:yes stop_codon:yes gene_type:complete
MNDSIFLITNYTTFSIKNTRIGLIVFGLLVLTFYVLLFLESNDVTHINPFLILVGLSSIITGTVGLSKKSRFSPKVLFNDEIISIREKLWNGTKKFNWNDITEIKLGSYRMTIRTKNCSQTFNINSSAQISIEIKKAVREIGFRKNISVIGG